jgi:NTE family protein
LTRPKIGLALGSGGARGLAHIGVLKTLHKHQIPVDFIAGSSMGSFIGAIYANDQDLTMLEKLATRLKRKHWLDLTVPKLGFIAGDKVKELIRLLTHGKNIEQLPIPLCIVATDLEKGERFIFREGPIATAVRASISIPGIFVPEKINGRYYIDGGVIDRVPITVVKEMGADFIIAVDVATPSQREMEVHTIFDVIARTIDIMEDELLRYRLPNADVIIRPAVGHIHTIAFDEVQDCIDEGERVTELLMDHIKEKINAWETLDSHDSSERMKPTS